jgi:hypothetical protein
MSRLIAAGHVERFHRVVDLGCGEQDLRDARLHADQTRPCMGIGRVDAQRELIGNRGIGRIPVFERDVALMIARLHDPPGDARGASGRCEQRRCEHG